MGTLQRRIAVVTVKVCQALAGAILLSVMPHTTTAAQVNVAYVELTICDTVISQGPIFASASNSVVTDTPLCHPAGPVASGAASFQVEFQLGLGPTYYNGRGYSNLAVDDGNPISHAFTGTDIGGDGPIRNILGSYLFNTNWTVYDGQQTEFYAGLKAQASNIANGHINDPLIITLPAGVTIWHLLLGPKAPYR